MKKSKIINLVLITAVLASCGRDNTDPALKKKVYMRSDSTAQYSPRSGNSNFLMWYYAFRPYGMYNNGVYTKHGYYSGGISKSSNIGSSSTKSGIIRGGFGKSGFSISS